MALGGEAKCGLGGGFEKAPAETFDRIPVFSEMLDSMRRDELVFHLRLKAPGLKFDILPVRFRQLVDPNFTGVIRAPGPGLFARHFTMICDMDDAMIRLLVVDAEEVALRVARK